MLSAPGGTSSEQECIRKKARRFTRQDGRLRYLDADNELKDCLTELDIKKVLHEYHDGAIGGDFGRDITLACIRSKFWWPTMWKDVADYIKTCNTCQRYGPQLKHNPLQPYRPVYPFEIIFMDYIVNLPGTACKNCHIVTMTEGLTKWCEAKAVKDATAANAVKFLFEDVVQRFYKGIRAGRSQREERARRRYISWMKVGVYLYKLFSGSAPRVLCYL